MSSIAKQKPTLPSSLNLDQDEEDAIFQRRNEKLRGLIDFHLPSGTVSTTTITPSNLIQYLGLVEQKANELMTLSYVVANPRKAILSGGQDVIIPAGGVSGLTGQGPQQVVGRLDIQAPATGYKLKLIVATRMQMEARMMNDH
jgi:hypothetical protein